MRVQISPNQTLQSVEEIITQELKGKEFWGDMDFSPEDYEALREKTKLILEHANIEYVLEHYPVSLTTIAVFLVRYKFNINFWGLLAEELNYPINSLQYEKEIGECTRNCFKKHGFDFSEVENDPRRHLSPIMYEAGLPPESSLDDLFYLLKYDSHTVFDPQLMIEDILQNRAYTIRKPLLRFFKRFTDTKAVDYLLEVHDTMIFCDQMRETESAYAAKYIQWREKENTKTTVVQIKNQEIQARPYLSFDMNGKGLCLNLPYTVMPEDWIETVRWNIREKNGIERSVVCHVYGEDGRRYVNSIAIPVSPDEAYYVSLEDEESISDRKLLEQTVEGIQTDKYLAFTSEGRLIHTKELRWPYFIMIVPMEASIETSSIEITERFFPTNNNRYRILDVLPLGQSAELKYNLNDVIVSLYSKPQVLISLSGKTLFYTDESNRLFTELPKVRISVEGHLIGRELEIRVGNKPIQTINNDDTQNEFEIDLNSFDLEELNCYGVHGIRLYLDGRFLKHTEFCLMPAIASDCSPYIPWVDAKTRKKPLVFSFERPEEWEIEFTNCLASSTPEKYTVECPPDVGSIRGVIRSTSDSIFLSKTFEIPVRPLEVSLLKGTDEDTESLIGKVARYDIQQLEAPCWITVKAFGTYRNLPMALCLINANGEEKRTDIRMTREGYGNINLSEFYDALHACPLPAHFEIVCGDQDPKALPVLSITEKRFFENKPSYSKERHWFVIYTSEGERDVLISRFGTDARQYQLFCRDSKLSKSNERRAFEIQEALIPGIYKCTATVSNSLFEDDADEDMELSVGTDTFFVSERGERDDVVTFRNWLELLIHEILSTGMNNDLSGKESYLKLKNVSRLERNDIAEYDIELMLSLVYLLNTRFVDRKKQQIKEIMDYLSAEILSGEDRFHMINALLKMRVSKELFDSAAKHYSFILAIPDADDEKAKITAERVERYSPEIAMVLLMSMDASLRDTIRKGPFHSIIGKTALYRMMGVSIDDLQQSTEEAEKQQEELKRFFQEQKGSSIRISLPEEIAGDFFQTQDMIEDDHGAIRFNVQKKPDWGISFYNIKFIDQYVNWYSLNHKIRSTGEIEPVVGEKMMSIVKQCRDDIVTALDYMKKDEEFSAITKEYDNALYKREADSLDLLLSINSPARFFYLQAIAAFFARLPQKRKDLEKIRAIGRKYLTTALEIAPRLSMRDILMAQTYIYLKRKENALCQ